MEFQRVRIWIDDHLIGESNTTGDALRGNSLSGGDNGGFGYRESSICSGEPEVPWPFEIGSSLLYHFGVGFMVNQTLFLKTKLSMEQSILPDQPLIKSLVD